MSYQGPAWRPTQRLPVARVPAAPPPVSRRPPLRRPAPRRRPGRIVAAIVGVLALGVGTLTRADSQNPCFVRTGC